MDRQLENLTDKVKIIGLCNLDMKSLMQYKCKPMSLQATPIYNCFEDDLNFHILFYLKQSNTVQYPGNRNRTYFLLSYWFSMCVVVMDNKNVAL